MAYEISRNLFDQSYTDVDDESQSSGYRREELFPGVYRNGHNIAILRGPDRNPVDLQLQRCKRLASAMILQALIDIARLVEGVEHPERQKATLQGKRLRRRVDIKSREEAGQSALWWVFSDESNFSWWCGILGYQPTHVQQYLLDQLAGKHSSCSNLTDRREMTLQALNRIHWWRGAE